MFTPGTSGENESLKRSIIAANIYRDPVGSKLTPEAHVKAVDFAVSNWPKDMGNGDAAQLGIRHVTQGVLK